MRYFLHIAFNGYFYRGWQRQPQVRTVQEVLEHTLSKILKEDIICNGCGRTDAQVHASQYILHIDVKQKLPEQFLFILNKNLPYDIVCFDFKEVDNDLHARYNAEKRTYTYFIHKEKNPFLETISAHYPDVKDFVSIKKAIELIPTVNNFEAFCLSPDKHNHTLCEIFSVDMHVTQDKKHLRFTITANRFLKSMIRLLVGAIIEIGSENLTLDEFKKRLIDLQYPEKRPVALPQGLYLSKIQYPSVSFECKPPIVEKMSEWISL